MSESSDGTKLAAKGAPITLVDGRVCHVRYGFRGVLELERRLGGTKAIDEAIVQILNAEGAAYTKLADFLCAGLLDDFTDDDEVIALLDSRQLFDYGQAVGEALAEAFPDATGNGNRGKAKGKASRGGAGTTRRPSSSDDQTKP